MKRRQNIVVLCGTKNLLYVSGRCALTEHAHGNKHINSITKGENFFKLLTK